MRKILEWISLEYHGQDRLEPDHRRTFRPSPLASRLPILPHSIALKEINARFSIDKC